MDSADFDCISRALTKSASRRSAMRILAGGAMAAALTRLGFEEAGAACRLVGQSCEGNRDCCQNSQCSRGKRRVCVCKEGYTNCSNRCRDLNNSRTSCGTCGNRCQSNEVCQSGDCCRPSFTLCTDVCQAGSDCSACCSGFCFSDNTC